MFTNPANTSFGGFSNPAQSSPFGQSTATAFGKPIGSTSFGTTPAPNVFGTNNQASLFNPKPATATTGGLFGSTAAPAFGQPATTQSTFGNFNAQPANTSLFGTQQNANTSLFGTNSTTPAFGQASIPTGFGTSTSTGLNWGAPAQQSVQQSTSFGQTNTATTSHIFSSPSFLGPTATVRFSPVLSTDTMVKNNETINIQTRHQCITCMEEYKDKSFEELRLEHYQAGLKRKMIFRQPPSSRFGENNYILCHPKPTPSTTTGNLFAPTTPQAFSQPANIGLFGASNPTSILQPSRLSWGQSFNTFNEEAPTALLESSNNSLFVQKTTPPFGRPSFGDLRKPLEKVENFTSWCVTNTFVKKDSFKWTIENFRYRTETRGESIKSSIFTSAQGSECEHNWRFDYYPNGCYDSSMDFVGLKINLLDDKHPDNIQVTMKISILNSFDQPVHTVGENAMTITIPETGIIYCPNFLNKKEIINNSFSFFPNDNLKILFEIGTMIGTSTKSKETKQAYSPKDQLRDQIFEYFNSGKLCDVVIEVDESEIKAHKLILSTQSPIFAAMFDEEVNKNRIKIDDMKLDVAKQLLEFIYTNKKPTRINEFTTELIIAAQKYQIAGLRIMCEEILFDSLSIDNAIKTLLLAHKHDINELKDFVIKFIQTHGSILRSNEFKDLENERPALAMEVYRVIAIEKADNQVFNYFK